METIKNLLKFFEKAGLYQGNILFDGREYTLTDGQYTIKAKPDVAALEEKKPKKIRGEQIPSEIAYKIKPLIKIVAVILVMAVTSVIFIINPDKESKPVLINKTRQKVIKPEKEKKSVTEGKKKSLEPEEELKGSTIESVIKAGERNEYEKKSEDKKEKRNVPNINNKKPEKVKRETKVKESKIVKKPKRFLPQIIQKPKIQFMKLPAGFRNEYLKKLKTIKVPGMGKGITIKGQVSITMDVGDRGNISIKNYDTKYLEVIPEYRENLLIRRIFTELKSIFLSPPLNSVGESVAVEDWRLIYRFGTFRGDLILNRVY